MPLADRPVWRGFVRKTLFALPTALLTLGAVEAMAWLTRSLIYGETANLRTDGNRSTQEPIFSTRANEVAGQTIHPFHSVVVDWNFHDLNIPPPRRKAALVVALLGGSVAGGVSREFRRALFRHVTSLGDNASPAPDKTRRRIA